MFNILKFKELSLILEMARINDKKVFNYDVFVYGGNSLGSGRNEHGQPHFQFSKKITGSGFKLDIEIPTAIEWEQNKELYIIRCDKNHNLHWTGLKKERKELIEWLDEEHHDETGLTNLEFIRNQWNIMNLYNTNVKKFKIIKLDNDE